MFEKWAERLREKNKTVEDEIEFKDFEEKVENEKPPVAPPVKKEEPAPASIEGGNIELKVVRPESFEDVSIAADHLIDGCTVVLNLELLDRPAVIRMLDFLNGVTYTLDGEIKNVAPNTYIITPSGIDIND
jgi:cell division inhibitor SepF